MTFEFDEPNDADSSRLKAKTRQPHAPVGYRLGAFLVDLVIMASIDVGVLQLTTRLSGLTLETVEMLPVVPLVVFFLLLNTGYVMILTALSGQTLGKMLFGIRVIRKDGEAASFLNVFLRTVAYAFSVLPAGLGLIGMFFGSRRALHDLAAGTEVVRR